ncbi:hypothetical protein ABZ864_07975 [Streptomyces sp. NPDC047082]|uniref:hypothetical protein n=1 Tax=Streptomyces sp. NPDC047082 TaxID=3155259 RepID=UPI0034051AB3
MLRRLLPAAPAHVLDVGGGSGVHAQWLVRDGHTVELLDPVPTERLDDPDRREAVLAATRRVESEPSLLGVSGQLLTAGRPAQVFSSVCPDRALSQSRQGPIVGI